MADITISKFTTQVVRTGSTPSSSGFAVNEGQDPTDPSGSGQFHLPVTIGTPANGLAVTEAQVLTIDKAQIFAGTSSQFVKGDGTLDSTAYGTGSVTSVGLTMPSAFNVASSPITTNGTIAVTGAGTTAQYVRGDGSLATFPSLTGFVPYTGATADVDLGTHDLTAERGIFANNGSSDTLTVNHTSGSGYGIIVTKGGNNEALYVSKTSGSGNAMTVVGGRTSLVDLALSSVSNTAGDFLTLSGGVVHKRTAAEVRTDIGAGTVTSVAALTLGTSGTDLSSTVANGTTTPVITLNVPTASASNRGALSAADWTTFNNKTSNLGTVTSVGLSSATSGVTIGSTPVTTSGTITLAIATASGSQNGLLSSTDWTTFNGKQNALTNPVTGTGTTNYLPKFTGASTIGDSVIYDNGGNIGIGITTSSTTLELFSNTEANLKFQSSGAGGDQAAIYVQKGAGNGVVFAEENRDFIWRTGAAALTGGGGTQVMRLTNGGNLGLGVTPSAWSPTLAKAIQIGNLGSSIWSYTTANTSTPYTFIDNNAYYNGTNDIYIVNNRGAARYLQVNNEHIWYTAPSGTAGNAISFTQAMTLGSNSGLSIGTTSAAPSQGLLVQGNVGIGVSPDVKLDVLGTSDTSDVVRIRKSSTGSRRGALGTQSGVGCLDLYNDSTELNIRLLAQGNSYFNGGSVGIGTDSPTDKLQMNGGKAIFATSNFNGTSAGGSVFVFSDDNNGGKIWAQKNGNSDWGYLALQPLGGNVLIGTSTNGASKLRISGLPTSAAGLSSGDVYNLSGVLMIA